MKNFLDNEGVGVAIFLAVALILKNKPACGIHFMHP